MRTLPLLVLALLIWRADFVIDDAYISFRYARNWAQAGVPAYNLGTLPPVEGYSNTLWVFILRWCSELGLGLEASARWLSCLFAGATLLLLDAYLAHLQLSKVARFFGTLSLACFAPFAVWSTGGLETASMGFFIFACHLCLSESLRAPSSTSWFGSLPRTGLAWTAGVLGLAVALSRVEGPLWVVGIAIASWVGANSMESAPHRREKWLKFWGVPLIGFAAFLVWRHATFGAWMANTVHAKGSLSSASLMRGVKTSASFVLYFPAVLAACAAILWHRDKHLGGPIRATLTMLTGFVLYNTLVGGDWMPFFRFLAPGSAFIALLLGILFHRLGSKALAVGPLVAGMGVLPLFGVSLAPKALLTSLYFRTFEVGYQTEWERWERGEANVEMFRMIGKGLRQIAEPNDSLTFGAIGAIGWESDMHIHDRNGLVDREVALRAGHNAAKSAGHDKQVPRTWFLKRKPTLFHAVIFEGPIGPEGSPTHTQATAMARGMIEKRVFSDPAESPLRQHAHLQTYILNGEPGLPDRSLLVVLRAND